jgi:hypothetical protein
MADRREDELERAKQDPAAVFAQPRDVLARADLAYEDKFAILQGWAAATGARQAEAADQDPIHQAVLRALDELQADAAVDPDQPEHAPAREDYRPRR